MPINVKHYIALGLGAGVVAVSYFNLATQDDQFSHQDAIELGSSELEFTPLSEFEITSIPKRNTVDPKDFSRLDNTPKVAMTYPGVASLSSQQPVQNVFPIVDDENDDSFHLAPEMTVGSELELDPPSSSNARLLQTDSDLAQTNSELDSFELTLGELVQEQRPRSESTQNSGTLELASPYDSPKLTGASESSGAPDSLGASKALGMAGNAGLALAAPTRPSIVQTPARDSARDFARESARDSARESSQPGTNWTHNPYVHPSQPPQVASSNNRGDNFQSNQFFAGSQPHNPTDAFPPQSSNAIHSMEDSSMTIELAGATQDSAAGAQVGAQYPDSGYGSLVPTPARREAEPTGSAQSTRASKPLAVASSIDHGIAPVELTLSDAAAQQAVHHIEYGKSLSRRGAAFAAQQEFYSALRVIAQSNDQASGSNAYSSALSRSVLALKEAKDFMVNDQQTAIVLDVAQAIEPHRSEILTADQAAEMTATQAMQRYLSAARDYLDFAGGRNVVSGEALYCLGKLHTAISGNQSAPGNINTAKAMVFHEAALQSDSNNFRSANELGVLMAQTGRLEEATRLFKQSLIVKRSPQAWKNLAETHQRLGQHEFAQLAESEFVMAAQTQVASSTTGIQWMPVPQFNAAAPVEFHERVASNPGTVESPTPAVMQNVDLSQESTAKSKSISQRLKDLF